MAEMIAPLKLNTKCDFIEIMLVQKCDMNTPRLEHRTERVTPNNELDRQGARLDSGTGADTAVSRLLTDNGRVRFWTVLVHNAHQAACNFHTFE